MQTAFWPNFEADVARHNAHIFIRAARHVVDFKSALAQARAVTLLAAVFARLIPFVGIKWVDGSNSMDAKSFIKETENIGQPDKNAVMFWVRVMLYQQPTTNGNQTR